MAEGQAVRLCREAFARWERGDETLFDDLVAEDFVNHAAGPQGRAGWRETLRHLAHDLSQVRVEVHRLFGDHEYACVDMTLHGLHVDSTMPLLVGVPVTGRQVAWRFTHVFRIADGQLVEHWATRDDLGLLRQLGAWPPA